MTSSNCLINKNVFNYKSNYCAKNLSNEELQDEKNKFFNAYREFQETRNLSLVKSIIIYGRNISDGYLQYYLRSSETRCLYSILDIHDTIFKSYRLVKNQPYYIKDECKYLSNHILVLFFLNRMTDAKKAILEYKNHCTYYKSYLIEEFHENFTKMNFLYFSLNYVSVIENGSTIDIDYRIGCQSYELNHLSKYKKGFELQRAIIVGSSSSQRYYRRFTIDMLRMYVALEYKPNELPAHRNHKNCRKWTFYNKSIFDIEIGINDATFNMSKRGIFLLYVSADAFEIPKSVSENSPEFLSTVGLKMNQFVDEKIQHPNEECMLPIDVLSFLETPTVIIIDSKSSHEFFSIKDHTKIPILCLLSPMLLPNYIVKEEKRSGKLFTYFLTCPLRAFCFICDRTKIDVQIMKELKEIFNIFMMSVEAELEMNGDNTLRLFMGDPVCRSLFLRYLFCNISLRLHEDFPIDGFLPKCNLVEVEKSIVNNEKFQKMIYSMAEILNSFEKFPYASDLSHTEYSIDVVY